MPISAHRLVIPVTSHVNTVMRAAPPWPHSHTEWCYSSSSSMHTTVCILLEQLVVLQQEMHTTKRSIVSYLRQRATLVLLLQLEQEFFLALRLYVARGFWTCPPVSSAAVCIRTLARVPAGCYYYELEYVLASMHTYYQLVCIASTPAGISTYGYYSQSTRE